MDPFTMYMGASVLGSLGAGLFGASQQKKAGEEITGMAQQNMAPFLAGGAQAQAQLNTLLGLGPDGAEGASAALRKTPGFQFALSEGLRGVTSSMPGMRQSGAAGKAATRFATGLAEQTYGRQVQALSGIAGRGGDLAMGLSGIMAQNIQAGAEANTAAVAAPIGALSQGIGYGIGSGRLGG